MSRLLVCEVVSCLGLSEEVFRLTVKAPELAHTAEPGQFVHVRVGDPDTPVFMLRRPFSVHQVLGDEVVFIVRRAGKGTRWLSSRRAGDPLDLLGPLGRGFTLPSSPTRVAVVAGGIGCGPLLFLIQRLKAQGNEVMYVAGGRHSRELFVSDEFSSVADEVRWATDDGSRGHHGFVTEVLSDVLREEPRPHQVFACGPEPMLRALTVVTREHRVPCQVSVEAFMACGVGVCLSCVHQARVEGSAAYVRVCAEGPVFSSDELIWEEAAAG